MLKGYIVVLKRFRHTLVASRGTTENKQFLPGEDCPGGAPGGVVEVVAEAVVPSVLAGRASHGGGEARTHSGGRRLGGVQLRQIVRHFGRRQAVPGQGRSGG